jgi:hypothetical protein
MLRKKYAHGGIILPHLITNASCQPQASDYHLILQENGVEKCQTGKVPAFSVQ